MAEVMDALRVLAEARGAAKPEGNAPLMNKLLLGTIKTIRTDLRPGGHGPVQGGHGLLRKGPG